MLSITELKRRAKGPKPSWRNRNAYLRWWRAREACKSLHTRRARAILGAAGLLRARYG